MKKTTIGTILKLPLILLILVSFLSSIYVIIKDVYPISIATPIILGVIFVLYLIGEFLRK